MDDFRLDCTTEIKTHSQDTALILLEYFHDNKKSPLGRIESYERTDGIARTLWTFKITENE